MSISAQCPQCGKTYSVPESAAGKLAMCTACGTKIRIPAEGGQAPAPAAPAPQAAPAPAPPAAAPAAPAGALPKQMVANRAVAGRTCPVCSQPIDLGQPVRNCELCGNTHHEACWMSHGGCGVASCGNAPLPKLAAQPGAAPAVAGVAPAVGGAGATKPCPFCGEQIAQAASKCRFCGEYLTAQAQAHGVVPQRCGQATGALVCGIISLILCGIVLGPIAIGLACSAKGKIARSNGALTGSGMATAGLILGILGAIGAIIIIIIQIGMMG